MCAFHRLRLQAQISNYSLFRRKHVKRSYAWFCSDAFNFSDLIYWIVLGNGWNVGKPERMLPINTCSTDFFSSNFSLSSFLIEEKTWNFSVFICIEPLDVLLFFNLKGWNFVKNGLLKGKTRKEGKNHEFKRIREKNEAKKKLQNFGFLSIDHHRLCA